MDISVNAKVECQNRVCGTVSCVIINPISKVITHIVVHPKGGLGLDRLVPVGEILESSGKQISLRCTADKLSKFELFSEGNYDSGDESFLDYEAENYYLHPYMVPEFEDADRYEPLFSEIEGVLPGELGIHRGATVQAVDGKVGQVDQFLISPGDNKITHLVLRAGHFLGQKLITIPVSQIARIEADTVYLKIKKQAVEKLPVIPVKHQ